MKKVGLLFRIFGLVTVLTLLLVLLPAPAFAQDFDLDPNEGEIGDEIDIDGNNFDPSTDPLNPIFVDIYFTSQNADEGDDIDDEITIYEYVGSAEVDDDGDFSDNFDVPDELYDVDEDEDVPVTGGTYYVCVTYEGENNIEAVAEFTVIASEITIDPTSGTVGTDVEITGTDFNDRETIIVRYDDVEIDIEDGDTETDSSGEFVSTIIIPDSTAGKHTISVEDETGAVAEAEFTVKPEITANPTKGAAGDRVTVNGTGFGADANVTVTLDRENVGSGETDSDGSFDVVITLPVKLPGTYKLEARAGSNRVSIDFTVAAGVNLSPATGNVGSQVTMTGTGFRPNTTVTVTYAPEASPVASVTADALGKFTATFNAPKSVRGAHAVTATDGVSTVSATFTMESTPPPAPQPLLPLSGAKAKSTPTFDWQDVTDPSGVTYTLQIAKDNNFSSMVLEKTGLTQSTYTLTKAEKLQSTPKDAPYYWRVRAVDGASNASVFTTPGTFLVGFTFSLTGWVLWVLIAIGGILLLLIGWLIGRRVSS